MEARPPEEKQVWVFIVGGDEIDSGCSSSPPPGEYSLTLYRGTKPKQTNNTHYFPMTLVSPWVTSTPKISP